MKPTNNSTEIPIHCECCRSNANELNNLYDRFDKTFTSWDKKQKEESELRDAYLEKVSQRIIGRLDDIHEMQGIIRDLHREVVLTEDDFPGITFHIPPKRNLFQRIKMSYYSFRKWIDRLRKPATDLDNNPQSWF